MREEPTRQIPRDELVDLIDVTRAAQRVTSPFDVPPIPEDDSVEVPTDDLVVVRFKEPQEFALGSGLHAIAIGRPTVMILTLLLAAVACFAIGIVVAMATS